MMEELTHWSDLSLTPLEERSRKIIKQDVHYLAMVKLKGT